MFGHTINPTLCKINCQYTYYPLYRICKIFWWYSYSKKDMDIDMIWYNILMVLQDRGYDIISQWWPRYEIWYYILEFGIFPTTGFTLPLYFSKFHIYFTKFYVILPNLPFPVKFKAMQLKLGTSLRQLKLSRSSRGFIETVIQVKHYWSSRSF